jgi:hypothetical protein
MGEYLIFVSLASLLLLLVFCMKVCSGNIEHLCICQHEAVMASRSHVNDFIYTKMTHPSSHKASSHKLKNFPNFFGGRNDVLRTQKLVCQKLKY